VLAISSARRGLSQITGPRILANSGSSSHELAISFRVLSRIRFAIFPQIMAASLGFFPFRVFGDLSPLGR